MKKILTGGLILVAGCQSVPTRELNEVEQARLDEIMQDGEFEESTAEDLVTQFPIVFDADGELGLEPMFESWDEIGKVLLEYYEAGKIYVFDETVDSNTGVTDESAAFTHTDFLFPENGYFALNSQQFSTWSYGYLKHEAAHVVEGGEDHSDEVKKALAENGVATAAAVISAVMAQHEFTYLVSYAYLIPDILVHNIDFEIQTSFDSTQLAVNDGRTTTADALQYYDDITAEFDSEDEFVDKMFDPDSSHVWDDFYANLGLTTEGMKEAVRKGDLFTLAQTKRAEKRAELADWLERRESTERTTERQRSSVSRIKFS